MKDISKVRQALEDIKTSLCVNCFDKKPYCPGVCLIRNEKCGVIDQFITDAEELIKENQLLVVENDGYKEGNRELYKENEELKNEKKEWFKEYNARVGELIKVEQELKDLKESLLENSQAIEPSVLEKIDKLENENFEIKKENDRLFKELAEYQNKNVVSVIGNFKYIEKQLAITTRALDHAILELKEVREKNKILDKALNKACGLAIAKNNCENYIVINEYTKEEYSLPLTTIQNSDEKILKDYLLKEVRTQKTELKEWLESEKEQ